MSDMLDAFDASVASGRYAIVERFHLPGRAERFEPIPPTYLSGAPGRWLSAAFPQGLWAHQAEALRLFEDGANIVVATGTASGKSLVFQAAALRILSEQPDATVLVFYPLKALVADQLVSWRSVLAKAGFSDETVARLDGDVLPDERERIINTARVIVATPDVTHAWLMGNLVRPQHKHFIGRLALVIIDEAHVLESVFGSNFAYLFRRVMSAARLASRSPDTRPLRVVGASATISNPGEHMFALTGLEFSIIDERLNGSPQFDRRVLHIAANGTQEAQVAVELHKEMLTGSQTGSFLTFVDSRQGAERLAIRTEAENDVCPYRSGYEGTDRRNIENALRAGSLRGVVSTSALELGVNIPHFSVGLNLGVPISRKSFRQRLGRVGRLRPGGFAIIAEPYAFRRYGSSLRGYYEGSLEPSYLYLQNRFIQYAHARCLTDELEMLGVVGKKALPGFVRWPDGFKEIFDFSYIGGPSARPREFDPIHRIGGDSPHLNYALRNVAEEGFIIATGGGQAASPKRVGNVSLQQAIREAFPGAIYLHMAKGWKVHEWRSTIWDRAIRVSPTPSRSFPKPLLRTFVNISLERDGVVDGRLRQNGQGFLAECQLQITERVEGFVERGQRSLYRDLQASDPNMRSKMRDFRTTGVVLRISDSWFLEKGVKQSVADALRSLLLREYSISPSDVDAAATNIALVSNGQRTPVVDAIVLFDCIYGSLRLTEPVYTHLQKLLDRLATAVAITPDEADLLPEEVVSSLQTWAAGLSPESKDLVRQLVKDGTAIHGKGWLQVYRPGSILAKRGAQGVLTEVEIIGPEIVTIDGPPRLCYSYRVGTKGKALASADALEPAGDEWSYVFWNPDSGDFLDTVDDLIERDSDRPIALSDSVSNPEI